MPPRYPVSVSYPSAAAPVSDSRTVAPFLALWGLKHYPFWHLMSRCERLSDDCGYQVRLQEGQEVVSLHDPDVAEMGARPVLLLNW